MADNDDFLAHVRETVTIMRPMQSVLPRGKVSPRTQQPTRSLRLPQEHLTAIDEASELLGVTRSTFLSWCAYQTALKIIEQHREFVKQRG